MSRTVSDDHRAGNLVSMLLVSALALALGGCDSGEEADTGGADLAGTAPAATTTAPAAKTAPKAPASTPEVEFASGASLYSTHCALCHGASGRGDGALAGSLNPPPRALIGEPWRFLKTGTPEVEQAGIVQLLKDGIPDSGMPKYGSILSDEELAALAQYVLAIRE
ncbi:MAG: c-type cytochrome [Planctomycetota bacterium]|jgi:mono/diheme cytochrome c family protein